MIDGGAHERQAEGHVDAAPERARLDRDRRLIVVERQDDVELPSGGAHEQGVGGKRPGHVQARAQRRLNRRPEDVALLRAEQAPFASVRVEGTDGDPGVPAEETPVLRMDQS